MVAQTVEFLQISQRRVSSCSARCLAIANADDHLDIRNEGSLYGDVLVSRICVEDGAYLTGSIDIRREAAFEAEEHEPMDRPKCIEINE